MPDKKGRESGGTGKISSISELLRSISRVLWTIAILILVAGLGKLVFFKSSKAVVERKEIEKPVLKTVDWSGVNSDVRASLETSRKRSQDQAEKLLDSWILGLMERVDRDFLPWYFGYWTQQKMGLEALLAQIWHWVDSGSQTAAEKITEEVQDEFTSRVLRPQIAQLEMERIINSIVSGYTKNLSDEMHKIPGKYKIKRADWERYISDISVMAGSVDASREISITLKVLTGAGAGGVLLLLRAVKPVITRIGAKISGKMSAKFASKMAAKTGSKVAVRAGGKFIGTIIAVGIIIWDVWDHYNTKKKAMPVLRKNIKDYFNELKESILRDPEFGVMSVIHRMELKIVKSLDQK